MLKVIFLCTGNSCRSQMAEGFARDFGKGVIEPYSVGLMPKAVNIKAIQVMKEIGIDISHQQSKSIDEKLLREMDIIVTLCDNEAESCPWTPPEIKQIHWSIRNPDVAKGTEEEIMSEFRKVRDQIKKKISKFIEEHKTL